MTVSDMKMTTSLPQENEDNGLYVLKKALMRRPDDQHLIVAVVDCKATTTNHDDGTVTVTMRVVSAEAVTEDDMEAARRLMRRAKDQRQGATVLPLDYGEAR